MLIVFDIDGTLVDEEKVLHEKTKQAIQMLQENGHYVALATGRPTFWYEEIREVLNIQTYISFNGQHVVYEGDIIYENPIEQNNLMKLYEEILDLQLPMAFLDDEKMVVTEEDNYFINNCFINLLDEYPKIECPIQFDRSFYQALIFTDKKLPSNIIERYSMFDFLHWHKYSYDILPKGGSKAVGIQILLEQLHEENIKVFAFGDGANDIEMIETADVGIAMDNGLPSLKQRADYVTDHVDDFGVVKALRYYDLI
ncbi:MAG TPA: Cof-type HAD-IIB family hydrolase [Bacillota bacterium]|nr:Cof-type HAD-IIB family hydrolase [Bacillota bacterium]